MHLARARRKGDLHGGASLDFDLLSHAAQRAAARGLPATGGLPLQREDGAARLMIEGEDTGRAMIDERHVDRR